MILEVSSAKKRLVLPQKRKNFVATYNSNKFQYLLGKLPNEKLSLYSLNCDCDLGLRCEGVLLTIPYKLVKICVSFIARVKVGTGLLNVEHVHIIGMSESAHIAGVTGEFISSGRVARITGLDPSRPFIDMTKKRGRLSVDDADLVDVVHTNAGTLGEQSAVGHIDFYPNGGKKQPGCENEFIGSCSHERAVLLFVESINSPHAFQAWRCENEWAALHDRCQISDTLATMGEHLSYRVNGSYLLKTTGSSPFER